MKFVKKAAVVAAAALIAAVPLTACGGGNGSYDMPEYAKDKHMDIIAWDVPDSRVQMVNNRFPQEVFDQVADAGYTVLMPHIRHMDFGSDPAKASDYMDKAYEAGLQVAVFDTKLVNAYNITVPPSTENIDLYKDHPAFYGVHIYDEPQRAQFSSVRDSLAYVREIFPDKMLFTNTCYTFDLQGDPESHLREYIEVVDPMVLSYDDYRIMGADGKANLAAIKHMAMLRYIAAEHNLPANNFLLALGHRAGTNVYRNPSVADLRWQSYLNMAYGYDSLAHFSWEKWEHPEDSEMIDYTTKEPTQQYYNIQTVNNEIHTWDHVYKSFTWQGTATVIGSEPSDGKLLSVVPPRFALPAKDIPTVQSISSTYDIVCGAFTDTEGRNGIMVTNAVCPTELRTAQVTMTFDKAYKGVLVYEKGEPKTYKLGKGGKITLDIEPGDGRFIIPLKNK